MSQICDTYTSRKMMMRMMMMTVMLMTAMLLMMKNKCHKSVTLILFHDDDDVDCGHDDDGRRCLEAINVIGMCHLYCLMALMMMMLMINM